MTYPWVRFGHARKSATCVSTLRVTECAGAWLRACRWLRPSSTADRTATIRSRSTRSHCATCRPRVSTASATTSCRFWTGLARTCSISTPTVQPTSISTTPSSHTLTSISLSARAHVRSGLSSNSRRAGARAAVFWPRPMNWPRP